MGKWDDDNISFQSPDVTIDCYDCIYKKDGLVGYANLYCEKYSSEKGKPVGILFRKEKCKFHKEIMD